MLNARDIVNNLMAKCESISQRMAEKVQQLVQHQADDEDDDNASKRTSSFKDVMEIKAQPKNLNKA